MDYYQYLSLQQKRELLGFEHAVAFDRPKPQPTLTRSQMKKQKEMELAPMTEEQLTVAKQKIDSIMICE